MQKNSIFNKLVLFITIATLIIGFVLTLATINISKLILLKQVKQTSEHNMKLIREELLSINDTVINTMSIINASTEFRQYLTRNFTTPTSELNVAIKLGSFIEKHNNFLKQDNFAYIISGIGQNKERYYYSDLLKWNSVPDDIINNYMAIDGNLENKISYFSTSNLFSKSVNYEHTIFVTKPLFYNNKDIYGYILLLMDEQQWFKNYEAYLTQGVSFSIVTTQGKVISSSKRLLIDNDVPTQYLPILTEAYKSTYTTIDRNNMTIITQYVPELDMYLLLEINQDEAFTELNEIFPLTILAVAIALIILIISLYLITKRLTDPLYQLVAAMQKSKIDDWIRFPITQNHSYEINVLAKSYNALLKQIELYTEQVQVEQTERRKADYLALQMQINPHFLYNTLTSIKYLAKLNRIDEVDQTITSLSSILQNTIGRVEDQVTLADELETLKHYVHINQIRYGDQIQVHFNINENCLNCSIPKLTIQPFVENSFFHAFPSNRKGNIYINARINQNRLLIEILDDGVGKHSQQIEKPKRQVSGIGVENVQHRIQLLYGQPYGISMEYTNGYGTVVTIVLPISYSQ